MVVLHADLLTEQILAVTQQPHVGPAFVQLEPAFLDSAPDAGAELRAASVERVEEGIVDLLDVDPAVLYRLDARSQLNELASGDFRIGEGAFGDEFHCWNRDGHDVAEDEEGMELSSMRQVQEEAARSLADMIRGASADMWALRLFLQNKGLPIVRSEFARS